MDQKKRYLSAILCAIFVAVLLVSGAFIATEMHHDCQGENCAVCAVITALERLLRVMVLATALGSVLPLAGQPSGVSMSARFGGAAVQTLVTLKVKLSD